MRTLPFPRLTTCALIMLGSTALSAQSATTFQLPPDPEENSRQQAEGPTDTEGQNRAAPRVIGTPTPTPAPTPAPTERTTPPAQANPRTTPSPTPSPSADAPAPRTSGSSLPASESSVSTREILAEPQRRPASRDAAPAPGPDIPSVAQQDAPAGDSEDAGSTSPTAPQQEPSLATDQSAAPPPPAPTFATDDAGMPWQWLAGLAAALIALLAIAIALVRRRGNGAPTRTQDTRTEEAPDLASASLRKVDQHSYPAKPDAGSLEIEAYAVTLSRSVMNATISYQISLFNRGHEPITLVQINGDVTSAHGRIPVTQQIANVDQSFPELHTLERLEPGQRSSMRGELRLPLREVRAIRQGNVPVFVPLLRLTVRAANLPATAYTYVIGSTNAQKDARPNPFRLDEPPRSYAQLSTRAVA